MSSARDKIIVRGIRFHGYHGTSESERRVGQKYEIDAELICSLDTAGRTDSLEHTVDYAEVVELMMVGELGAVVEGDGLSPSGGGEGSQEVVEGGGDGAGGFAGQAGGHEQAGVTFMQGEEGLSAASGEEHEVGLPVPGGLARSGVHRALCKGSSEGDERDGTAAFGPAPPAFGLGLGQEVAPVVVLGAGDLGVDETVDGFVGDDAALALQGQSFGHLLRRPALSKAPQHRSPKGAVAVELRAAPTPGSGLVLGIARLVALSAGSIPFQLPSNA